MFARRSSILLAVVTAVLALTARAEAQKQKPRTRPSSSVQPEPKGEKWWQERHAQINDRLKKGDSELIFIGDSITHGWESDGRSVWEKFYGSRKAVNMGISGDRTQHVLWRLDYGNFDLIKPKLAVLMIGTNNSRDNTSEQIAAGLKAIVEKLRTKLPQTRVLLLAIFPRDTKEDPKRKVSEGANAIIKNLADDKMVFYLDIGPKFLSEDGTLSRDVMPDLLHLNEKSYRIWAEAIEPSVKKLMGE
jgi:beta-glucosidase